MKHVFTLICALMVMMSASAVPQRNVKKQALMQKQARMHALPGKKSVQQSVAQWGQKLMATPAYTSHFAMGRTMNRAARRATTNVTITQCLATFYPAQEEGGVNTMYYGLHTDDFAPTFYFSIIVPEGKHEIELDKEYTLADMEEGSCEWDDDDWVEHYYTAATFKKTRGEGYDVHVTATVTDTDGNTFVLNYDEEPITLTGNTVMLNIENPMTAMDHSSDGSWFLRANDDTYEVQICYYSDDNTSRAGSFSGDAIDLYSSYVKVNTGQTDEYEDPIYKTLQVKEASCEVTETDLRIDATLNMLASDGNRYQVTMFYVKPHAETYETITATNVTVNDEYFDWWGEVQLLASDDKNSVKLVIFPEGLDNQLAGTYTIGELGTTATVTPFVEGEDFPESIDIYSGQFTVTSDNGNISITGKLVGYNNVEYTLNLSYTKPVATRQESITFPATELIIYSFGAWQAMGYNADQTKFISIAAEADEVAGSYKMKNLLPDYTYVVTDISGRDGKVFECVDANLTVTYDATTKTAHITGTMLCKNTGDATDIPEFTVDVTGVVPPPYAMDNNEQNFAENFPAYALNTEYVDEGVIYVDVRNSNGAIAALEFWVAEGTTTLAPGTYPINDSHTPQTVSMSEGTDDAGRIMYSFVGYANEQNQLSDIWFLVSGTVTIAEDGMMTLDALNSNGKTVKCVLGATGTGIDAIQDQEAVCGTKKHLENGRLVIQKNGIRYNALGVAIK